MSAQRGEPARPTYSDGDLLTAVHLAIQARDWEAVAAILHVLAVQNPRAAQDVLDIVELAKVINR